MFNWNSIFINLFLVNILISIYDVPKHNTIILLLYT